MGNRALITLSTQRAAPAIYLHWNGGRASVLGFLKAARQLGIARQDIVAMGDGLNDLDLLTNAGIGIAMGNADPRIARRFRGIDNTRFKAAFGEQLCASLGGPCRHAGPSMKDVHASMGIADVEFNAMTQDLRRALAGRGVSVELQVEVAAAMEPMRDDIVSPIVPADSVVITEMVRRPAAAVAAGKKPVAKKGAAPAKANAKATTAKKEPEPKNPIVRRKWRRPEGA